MIAIKNEGNRARVRGIQPETVLAMQIVGSIFTKLTQGRDMVVTSACELGDFRKKGSRHLSGYAFDLRTRGLSDELIAVIAREAREALGPDYDVVDEGNHIHIEFDPTGE